MTEQMELMMIAKETERSSPSAAAAASMSRKEKRKAAKKEKRKQKRKEVAEKDRQEFEVLLNDPEERRRIQFEEEKEKERLERERREFEEREWIFLEELARRKAREEEEREEEERRRAVLVEEQKLSEQQVGPDMEANEDEGWEYVEEGPPEIIWQGNEIIVKKNRVRVKKKSTIEQLVKEDENRPISNPLPPQSEAFADHKNASTMLSAQQLLENVAQQTPNFGTEQDKAHCPFHLKTGACRFGARCSRVHFYPDKSCTILIKNMYSGPGLVWEQDEGLEVPGSGLAWVGVQRFLFSLQYCSSFYSLQYTEEEVEHSFEEFYEDVHTEFLKFGELVNFKVCRNGSHHLRGNVYVHYKSLESAMLAYHSINGRYFAGKQVNCEFVAVTRWKVAICGEYVKSNLKTCSRGSACNFIHCFRNPGGDYEWADWDKPPPRHWVEKMAALFGYSVQSECDKHKKETPRRFWDSSKRLTRDKERYHYRRSQSKEIESSNRSSSDPYEEDNVQRTKNWHATDDKGRELLDRMESREKTHSGHHHWPSKKRSYDSESVEMFSRDRDADILRSSTRKCSRYHRKESYDSRDTHSSGSHDDTVLGTGSFKRKIERHGQEEHREKNTGEQEMMSGVVGNLEHKKRCDSTDSSRGPSCEDWEPATINDQRHRRLYDYDSTSESSDGVTERCHEYRRKSSRDFTEVSRISNDFTESHKISGNKSLGRESEQVNSELFPVQKQSSSSRKNVEVVSLDGHKRSDAEHQHRKSNWSDWRSESYDSDFSYGSSKMNFMKKHKKVLSGKSKQKFGSDDKGDYDHTKKDSQQDDANGYFDDDIDRRGRWESDQVDTEKQKHRRKYHSRDYKHDIGCGSRDQSSDEYLRESRSRSSSKSSNKKHKTRSKEMDSDAGLKEFDEEDGMINERNYRSGSKRHEKKTSS